MGAAGQKFTRGQKYVEAKVVRLGRGLTTRIDIQDVDIYDAAANLIADYLTTETCVCETVVLRNNGFTTAAFRVIAPCFARNNTVRSFSYIGNRIGECSRGKGEADDTVHPASALLDVLSSDGAQLIAKSLRLNRALTHLHLEDNDLGDLGCVVIAEALDANAVLRELCLVKNNIGDQGCFRLARALANNGTLASLDLNENRIGDEGFLFLLDAISYKNKITELNLRANLISAMGSEKVAEALEVNTSLLELNLRRNNLQDAGCALLAKGLSRNATLRRLHLSSNRIGDEGSQRLAEALESNTVLDELYLEINAIEDQGCSLLADVLETNSTLRRVDLRMNNFGGEGYSRLENAVSKNGTLSSLELSDSLLASKRPVEMIKAKLSMNLAASGNVNNPGRGGSQVAIGAADVAIEPATLADKRHIAAPAAATAQSDAMDASEAASQIV